MHTDPFTGVTVEGEDFASSPRNPDIFTSLSFQYWAWKIHGICVEYQRLLVRESEWDSSTHACNVITAIVRELTVAFAENIYLEISSSK